MHWHFQLCQDVEGVKTLDSQWILLTKDYHPIETFDKAGLRKLLS